MSQPSTIKPMPFWLSSLFFGIPSAIGWLGIYVGLPALARAGVPLFWNSLLCIVGPLVLMLAAAFVAYRLEGNPLSWAGVRARFRLKPLRRKEWFWTLGLCLVCPGTYFLLSDVLIRCPPPGGWPRSLSDVLIRVCPARVSAITRMYSSASSRCVAGAAD